MRVRYYSVIAASTGRTEQVFQAGGHLHAIQWSPLANATLTIYESSTTNNPIASFVASSNATNNPDCFDMKGLELKKLTAISTGSLSFTILYS